jgi:transposase, IS30 family
MPGTRITADERIKIETLWEAGWSVPAIADCLGRHRSTVWREIDRNNSHRHGPKNPSRAVLRPPGRMGVYAHGYHAGWAQEHATERARRRRQVKCGRGHPVRALVLERLRRRWSPQQIAASLRQEFPDRPELWVSHETIYQAIYVQSRGNLRAELTRQVALRSGRAARKPRAAAAGAVRSARPWVSEQFHISRRPAQVADRAVPGHWEGDLLIGRNQASAIVTLVERATRYVLLGALPDGRASEQVIDVLSRLAQHLPAHLLRSLTWDCGAELAYHDRFRVATGCPVYFCDPHSPWQRGSNENTNGLLRQYYPKGVTDFRTLTQADLDAVALELNQRPRQTLAWKTPAQALNELLVAAAT